MVRISEFVSTALHSPSPPVTTNYQTPSAESRRDYLTKLLVEFISLPALFHPITFLIKRQIDRERELACDELVTKNVLSPDTYARSLLSAADLALLPAPYAIMLSIFDGRILEKRIMRLT